MTALLQRGLSLVDPQSRPSSSSPTSSSSKSRRLSSGLSLAKELGLDRSDRYSDHGRSGGITSRMGDREDSERSGRKGKGGLLKMGGELLREQLAGSNEYRQTPQYMDSQYPVASGSSVSSQTLLPPPTSTLQSPPMTATRTRPSATQQPQPRTRSSRHSTSAALSLFTPPSTILEEPTLDQRRRNEEFGRGLSVLDEEHRKNRRRQVKTELPAYSAPPPSYRTNL